MSYTVEKIASNKVKLSFVESAESFDAAVEKAYLKDRSRINVPGFRKGKAPRKLIENMYGEGVFYDDAFELVAQPAYEEAIKAENLQVVDRPQVDVQQIGAGQELKFTLEVFVKPDVTLGEYKGVAVEKNVEKVTDEAVDARIQNDVERASTTQDVTDRPVENGDIVNLDYAGSVDGVAFEGGSASGFMLTLGSDALIDGFEDGICGMQPGEEKQLDLVFPADYNPAYAGKAAIFTVRLNHIYPTPNDAIAVQYWNAESLDAYRATLRAELEGEAQAAFEIAKEEAAWTKVLANSRVIQYPEAALNEAFENNVRVYEQLAEMYHMTYEEIFPTFYGLSVADAETILFNSAKNLTAQRLLLYAVSKDMGLDVSDEKFDAELAATAAVLGLDSVDTLIKQLGKSKTALKEDKLYAEVITKITAEANFVVSAS